MYPFAVSIQTIQDKKFKDYQLKCHFPGKPKIQWIFKDCGNPEKFIYFANPRHLFLTSCLKYADVSDAFLDS